MATLPPELWIIIFDLVIEEGIVRLDQCDYTTFPYDHYSLPGRDRRRFYESYHRLRLVCRNFNALLGTRPQCELDVSSFPFPMCVRALHVEGSDDTVFQRLLEDTSRCEGLVFLDISCDIIADFDRPELPDLLDLLSVGEAGAFPNVKRLTLRIYSNHPSEGNISFWTPLHRGFSQLVTLSIYDNHASLYLKGEPGSVATFERLETLHLGLGVSWPGCDFPRLRHASVQPIRDPSALDTFQSSAHLECLLLPSDGSKPTVDVRSFPRLRVLSVHEEQLHKVVAVDYDHPLEHLWLYLDNISKNPGLIDEIMKRVPRIFRITLDLSSVTPNWRTERIQELKGMRLDRFGLALKPVKVNPRLLVIKQSATLPKDGILGG